MTEADTLRYDPYDPATQRDPFPIYDWLRDEDPAHRTPRGYVVLSRFADVFDATIDTATFSSGQGLTFERNEIERLGLKPTLVMMDRPDHTIYRRLISRLFTPRSVARREEEIRAFVRSRLDLLRDGSDADLIDSLAGPLPTMVVASYLGVPERDRSQFDVWSNAIVQANAGGDVVGGAPDAVAGLYDYFSGLIEQRRSRPGDDMLSDLALAEVDGHPLGIDEILGYCFVMIAGGNDTVTGLLGGAAVALTERMDQRRALLDDPSLLPAAIEELLRWTSPVQGLSRTATRPVTLHGTSIDPGTKVHLLYGSANRDPREFGDDAGVLDVRRPIRRMLSFGNGPHHCIGAAAARLQARVALEELFGTMPDFVVDPSAGTLAPGPFIRRFSSLPFRATGA